MKQILLSTLLVVTSLIVFSQETKTRLLNASANWNIPEAWSPEGTPVAGDHIIIPDGIELNINQNVVVGSITSESGSILTLANDLKIQGASTFEVSTIITWSAGSISGGGILTNNGQVSLTTTNNKSLLESTSLINNGEINIDSSGDLLITDGTLTNQINGVLELKANAGNITWSGGSIHILDNYGVIKKTTSVGEAQIHVLLTNYGGEINVESGILSFQNAIGKNLIGGTYNVSSGAAFDWDNLVFLTGILTGVVDGNLNWNNRVSIPELESATFSFSGIGRFNWTASQLEGGGTLVNQSKLYLTTTNNKSIKDDSILSNEGELIIESSGDLYITDGVVNNQIGGIIEMQANAGNISWSGGSTHILNNYGTIKKTTSEGEAQIHVLLTNHGGEINVEMGALSFQNTIGKHLVGGTYNVSSGATFDWDNLVYPTGVLTGTIDGNLNWNNRVSIPDEESASFSFSGLGKFNWTASQLDGGGTLVNQSKLYLTTTSNKSIKDNSILNNESELIIESSGDLYIVDGEVNNQVGGIIEMQTAAGNITWSGGIMHILNNYGIIKRTTTEGEAQIHVLLTNYGGEVSVESGVLSFQNAIGKNLIGGTYNVSSGASFDWDNLVNASGIISGSIDGNLNWNNRLNISLEDSAYFAFSGVGKFDWKASQLEGGGTFINQSKLHLSTTSNKSITGNSIMINQGELIVESSGDLYISEGIVTNEIDGIIEFTSDAGNISWSGGDSHILNNEGLIVKSGGAGTTQIVVETTNDGTIQGNSGILALTGIFDSSTGSVGGISTVNWPNGHLYTGTISPGLSPGTLTHNGSYLSSSEAVLEMELNGLIADADYDVFNINGSASFNGNVDVILDYEYLEGAMLTIATVTGDITTCNLAPQASHYYLGNNYVFGVTCDEELDVVNLDLQSVLNYVGTGDYNFDGFVTVQDLTGFLGEFGAAGDYLIGDFNGDGAITVADLTPFLSAFGSAVSF